MVEQKATTGQAVQEIPLSIPFPDIPKTTYNELSETFEVSSIPNSTPTLEEKTWEQELVAVSKHIENFTRDTFSDMMFNRNGNIIQTTITTIDHHFSNNRLVGDAALLGFGVVLGAYNKDQNVKSSLDTLLKQPPKGVKEIAEAIFPKPGGSGSSLQDMPKIPENKAYIKKLVERIAGISMDENGKYQISDPLVDCPVQFYMGAVFEVTILEDSWNKAQANKTKTTSEHADVHTDEHTD